MYLRTMGPCYFGENRVVARGLPGNQSYKVKVDTIHEYINDWFAPFEDIVYHMDTNICTQLPVIVHETFMMYIPGGLHALVRCVHRLFTRVRNTLTDRCIVEER